jgi:hypothetical protein
MAEPVTLEVTSTDINCSCEFCYIQLRDMSTGKAIPAPMGGCLGAKIVGK